MKSTGIISATDRGEQSRMIGANLRAARKAAGMTIEKASDALGLSKAAVVGYELGTRNTTVHRLCGLCRAYGVPVTSVLGVTDSDEYDAGYRAGWSDCRAKAHDATGDAHSGHTAAEPESGSGDGREGGQCA